jgi:hypothetical protein
VRRTSWRRIVRFSSTGISAASSSSVLVLLIPRQLGDTTFCAFNEGDGSARRRSPEGRVERASQVIGGRRRLAAPDTTPVCRWPHAGTVTDEWKLPSPSAPVGPRRGHRSSSG